MAIDEMRAVDDFLTLMKREYDVGNYDSALEIIRELGRDFPDHPKTRFCRHGMYIDIGLHLDRIDLVQKGIRDGKKIRTDPEFLGSRALISYNIANGYGNLDFLLRKEDRRLNLIIDNENLQNQKKEFRKAIQDIQTLPDPLKTRVWTNFGNCLCSLGRGVEGMDAYHQALLLDPQFSMAAGNLAMEMRFFAAISGEYRPAIDISAYQVYCSIIDRPDLIEHGGISSRESFLQEMRKIEGNFKDPGVLDQPIEHPPINWDSFSLTEQTYYHFCLEHRFFLNLHIHDLTCMAAVGDPVFIPLLVNKNGDSRADLLVTQINQIKEDYISARFILFLALQRNEKTDNISRLTRFANLENGTTFTLYSGLLKTSFKEAFGVLDKIAGFLNAYLEIGLGVQNIQFDNPSPEKCVWRNGLNIRPEILNCNNISLYALYDIYLDFISKYYTIRFQQVRNALVHRTLEIVVSEVEQRGESGKERISYPEMIERTTELLQIVRSAIIYTITFVAARESEKNAEYGQDISKRKIDITQYLDRRLMIRNEREPLK
jgi:tetratricopeptide (TPR) repeat protein